MRTSEDEKNPQPVFDRLRSENRDRVLEAVVASATQDERYAEAIAKAYAKTLTLDEIIGLVHVPS